MESARSMTFTRGWRGWDDPTIGCVPKGDVRTVRGTVRVTPFGKGDDGTEIVEDDGGRWIVDYGATDQHRNLDGKRVVVRGRVCDKQLQAREGQHFDIDSLALDPGS